MSQRRIGKLAGCRRCLFSCCHFRRYSVDEQQNKRNNETPLQTMPPADKQTGFEAFDYPGKKYLQEELRIVMIGRTGAGKSATGNSILGRKYFKSSMAGTSVTKRSKQKRETTMGRTLQVIDTPGFFDTEMSQAEVTRELAKCFGMSSPGPHAVILVTSIGRFTKEEQDTIRHFKSVFGESMLKHFIVLFTRKDDLDRKNITIEQFISKVSPYLRELLNECKQRFIAFDNEAPQHVKDQQVQQLINMIDSIVENNAGKWYTTDMFTETEKVLRRREQEIMEQIEEQTRKERAKIEIEFEKYQAKQQGEDINELKIHIEELNSQQQQANDEEATSIQQEILELRKTVLQMEDEMIMENESRRVNHTERLEHLDQEYTKSRLNVREKVRKEVEEGIQNVIDSILNALSMRKGVTRLIAFS